MKPFLAVLQFIFGCRHRHLSRTFTIKHRTYRVCFDCAHEFDMPDAQAPVLSPASADARLGKDPHHAR
jgi:hypothetical protein